MTGVDDIEEFSKVTINAVTENDHKELEKILEVWNTKLEDHELRIQVLGIGLTIAEMNGYHRIAKMILESDHRSAMVVNTATGRTPLQSAIMRNCPAMVNLLKIYSTIH